jgi:hypothetical protein
MVVGETEAIDRNPVSFDALPHPFAINITVHCRPQEELTVMAPLGQVVRIPLKQIVGRSWNIRMLAAAKPLLKPENALTSPL